MSVKYTISNDDLKKLTSNYVIQIVDSFVEEFNRKNYLLERYSRKDQLEKNRKEKDPTKSEKIITFEKSLVDTAAGYGLNKSITYYDKDDENMVVEKKKNLFNGTISSIVKLKKQQDGQQYYKDIVKINNDNERYLEDTLMYRRLLITGSCDNMVYTDEEGKIQIVNIYDDCVALYDNTVKPKMVGFIRTFKTIDIDTNEKINYEVYTEKSRWKFCADTPEKTNEFIFGGYEQNPIPFVRYDIEESFIESNIPNIRDLELIESNTKHMLNYNDTALLMLKGFALQNVTKVVASDTISEDQAAAATQRNYETALNDLLRMFSNSRVILPPDGGDEDTDAKWLTKTIDDSAITNYRKSLTANIYASAGTFDPNSDNMVYQNTLSLMFKLYNLETKTGLYLDVVKKGVMDRLKLITNILNFKAAKGTEYDYHSIGLTFNRDIPTNISEELQFMVQAKGQLSLLSIYEKLSFVEDPVKELERFKEGELEMARLEGEKSQIMSELAADATYYETPNRNGDNDKKVEDGEEE